LARNRRARDFMGGAGRAQFRSRSPRQGKPALPLDSREAPPSGAGQVRAAVYRLVRRIPSGFVLTYGEIAARIGKPGGARAVGHAMRVCPPDIPWHRVVNSRGEISPRAPQSGMVTQRIRLEHEGVAFRAGRIVMGRHRWRGEASRGQPARAGRRISLAQRPAGAASRPGS